MKVLNEFPNSHHYWDEYELTDLHCMKCGNKTLWTCLGEGDFYAGANHICTSCGCSCSIANYPVLDMHDNSLLQLKQLRTGVTSEPTTREGN